MAPSKGDVTCRGLQDRKEQFESLLAAHCCLVSLQATHSGLQYVGARPLAPYHHNVFHLVMHALQDFSPMFHHDNHCTQGGLRTPCDLAPFSWTLVQMPGVPMLTRSLCRLYSHPPPGLWPVLSYPSRDGPRTYADYIHAHCCLSW